MHAEPRALPLGKLRIDGEEMVFHLDAAAGAFEARPGEALRLVLRYAYRETSKERDDVRIALWAELGDRKLGAAERNILDQEMKLDDRKGFLDVPFAAPPAGAHAGRFRVEARYVRGAWSGGATEEWLLEREGKFQITVKGASNTHRV